MRKPIIIGNWKMNLTIFVAKKLAGDIESDFDDKLAEQVDAVVCPTYLQISDMIEILQGRVGLGAQDVYWEKDDGAYTGELSPEMLKEAGCEYVIIGHSERREYLGETDKMVGRKVAAALASGLVPIICVGENKKQRDRDETEEFIERQVLAAVSEVGETEIGKVIVAYEPIWAIGSGDPASSEDAEEVAVLIRSTLTDKFTSTGAQQVRILYGGSAKADNIAGFIAQDNVDGALVGGASLDAEEFVAMLKNSVKSDG